MDKQDRINEVVDLISIIIMNYLNSEEVKLNNKYCKQVVDKKG